MSNNLQPGTRMSDIDATVADVAEERSCESCGHDAGECTCAEDAEEQDSEEYEPLYWWGERTV